MCARPERRTEGREIRAHGRKFWAKRGSVPASLGGSPGARGRLRGVGAAPEQMQRADGSEARRHAQRLIGGCRYDLARTATARAHADSRRSVPYFLLRRRMPRHEREPCSGWRRSARIASTSAAVCVPIVDAQLMSRDGDHSACARCAFGMCSARVVCRPRS